MKYKSTVLSPACFHMSVSPAEKVPILQTRDELKIVCPTARTVRVREMVGCELGACRGALTPIDFPSEKALHPSASNVRERTVCQAQ